MNIHRWSIGLLVFFLFFVLVLPILLAQENLPSIIKRIEPSVVVIQVYDSKGKAVAQGSGFFITEGGDVITNWHVIEGASRAEVKTAEGKVYPITHVVAEDREGDLVQISVDIPKNAVTLLSINKSLPEKGERVIVLGSPLGFELTVSDGIVSAVREIPAFGKMIQITAPISPGSSGSPVVNMRGEVVGVATFQVVEGYNLNFAIPGERVAKLIQGKRQAISEWGAARTKGDLDLAEEQYHRGMAFFWVDDYQKALLYFEKVAKINSRHPKAFYYIGCCYGELGRLNEAVQAYKQAIRIKPDYAEEYNNLGVTYDNLGRLNEAVETYKQAIRIKPDYAEAYRNLGVAYSHLGRLNEAVQAYKQAISINPDYAEAYRNLGVTYGELGRLDESVQAFKQAIRINPDYAEAYYDIGVTYSELRRWNEAVEAYKQAIHINPDYADAYYNLGVAYAKLDRLIEAVQAYKQATRIKTDYAEAYLNLGVAYAKLDRLIEAVQAYKQATRIKPDYADAYLNLGIAYWFLDDKGAAMKQYNILKNLDLNMANQLFNIINM